MTNPIILQRERTGIAAYRAKKGFLPAAVRLLTSPKTTIVLGATLATLATAGSIAPAATGATLRAAPGVAARGVAKLAPKSIGGAVKLVTGAGIVSALGVPGIKKVTKKVFKTGEKIGEIIDEPGKASDVLGLKEKSSLKEKAITGFKAAGLVGGVAAVAVGGVAAIKKGKAMLEERAAKKLEQSKEIPSAIKELGFTEPKQVGLGGVPLKQASFSQPQPQGEAIKQPAVSNIIQIQIT